MGKSNLVYPKPDILGKIAKLFAAKLVPMRFHQTLATPNFR